MIGTLYDNFRNRIPYHHQVESMALYYKKLFLLFILLNIAIIRAENTEETLEEPTKASHTEQPTEANEVNPEEAPQIDGDREHANGSICAYCSYCKFCKLCDKDCPCSASKSKPNCHLCKYCKYCYLCSALCDTVCQPGGFLDTVSSKIWNSLPTFDGKMKETVDKDIDSAKDWIKEYL